MSNTTTPSKSTTRTPAKKPSPTDVKIKAMGEEITRSVVKAADKRINERMEEFKAEMATKLLDLDVMLRENPAMKDAITRAHGKVDQALRRLNAIDPNETGKFAKDRHNAELDEIENSVRTEFETVNRTLAEHQTQIDQLKIDVADRVPTSTFNGLVGKHDRLTGRVYDVETEVKSNKIPRGFIIATVVISLIVGLIAYVMWISQPFQTSIALPGGTKIPVVDWRQAWYCPWAAAVCGFAAVWLIAGIGLLIVGAVKKRQSQDRASDRDREVPVAPYHYSAPVPTPTASSEAPKEDAATKPLPNQGAMAGAQ